jgi:DNA-binding transcriptional MerR regulator
VGNTIEELRQRVQREQELIARLRTANVRFTDAQTERIWAIVSAHQAGLSIRKIAGVTGLSSSRIHQLLRVPEAREIPVWLSQLRESTGGFGPKNEAESPEQIQSESRLSREVETLRRCIDWLQRLERGENVIVNLRLDTDLETEFVSFERPRVIRVLERIAADLDELSQEPNDPRAEREANRHDPQARHRRELAEPSPEPKKMSHREERTALRAELGLPPE